MSPSACKEVTQATTVALRQTAVCHLCFVAAESSVRHPPSARPLGFASSSVRTDSLSALTRSFHAPTQPSAVNHIAQASSRFRARATRSMEVAAWVGSRTSWLRAIKQARYCSASAVAPLTVSRRSSMAAMLAAPAYFRVAPMRIAADRAESARTAAWARAIACHLSARMAAALLVNRAVQGLPGWNTVSSCKPTNCPRFVCESAVRQ